MGSDAAKPGPRGCARAPGGAGPRQPRGNAREKWGGDPASGFRGEDSREAFFWEVSAELGFESKLLVFQP